MNGVNDQLSIIVPVYDEGNNLEALLPELLDKCKTNHWKIILVNDGSTDETREILARYSNENLLKVIHHKLNKGYGAAIKSGLAACETQYAITFDADGQHWHEDIDVLRASILDHDADMVVGSRKGQRTGSLTRSVGKGLIRLIAKLLMTVPIHDLNSGMKIYRTDLARQYPHLPPDGMSFSDTITLIFINNRHLVLEEPIRINARKSGKSSIRVQTAFQTIMEIINIVILFNPMKIFLPISMLFFIITLAWAIPIIILGRGISIGSLLGIVAGLIFLLLGLITEQLAQIRRNQPGPNSRGS